MEIGPRLLITRHTRYIMTRRSRNSEKLGSSDSTESTRSRSSKKKKLIKDESNGLDDSEKRNTQKDENSQQSISSRSNGKAPVISIETPREHPINESSSGSPATSIGINIFSKLNAGKGTLSSSAKR